MIATARLFRDQPLRGTLPPHVTGVARDSRTLTPGMAYVSQATGAERERHLAEARARGAAVTIGAPGSGAEVITSDPRWTYARASAAAHGLDEACPPLVGTTGTKGNSTVTHLLWWCLGAGAARVGTIGWHDGRTEVSSRQTTPPPEELHAFLATLPSTCPGVALEVSSHGADQHRLAGLTLEALAVTGLGHDHLDYHGTLGAYLAAKLRACALVRPGGLVVINADDPRAHAFVHAAYGRRVRLLGLDQGLVRTPAGWTLDGVPLPTPLRGDFNAWNAAAAVLLAEALGIPRATACARLATCPAVPGRCERLAESPATYVDYAHTADSLARIIAALRAEHPGAPLAIVFGCGGDRDTSKRAPMGAAAAAADVVVITTDNSRSEAPAAIAAQICAGIPAGTQVLDLPDRAEAIRAARTAVGPRGVVIVAGKGHETTQDILGAVTPWDDRAFVRSLTGGAP